MRIIRMLVIALALVSMTAVVGVSEEIQITGGAGMGSMDTDFIITGTDLVITVGYPGSNFPILGWTSEGIGNGGTPWINCDSGCGSWGGIVADVVVGSLLFTVQSGQSTVPADLTLSSGEELSGQSVTALVDVSGSFTGYSVEDPGDCGFNPQGCGPVVFTGTVSGTGTVLAAPGLVICESASGCSPVDDANSVFYPNSLVYTFSGTADVEATEPALPAILGIDLALFGLAAMILCRRGILAAVR